MFSSCVSSVPYVATSSKKKKFDRFFCNRYLYLVMKMFNINEAQVKVLKAHGKQGQVLELEVQPKGCSRRKAMRMLLPAALVSLLALPLAAGD